MTPLSWYAKPPAGTWLDLTRAPAAKIALRRGSRWISSNEQVAVADVPVELQINSLAGPLCTIAATRFWSLHKVKAAIEASAGIPVYEQRVVRCDVSDTAEPDNEVIVGSILPPGDAADLTVVRCAESPEKQLRRLFPWSGTDWSR